MPDATVNNECPASLPDGGRADLLRWVAFALLVVPSLVRASVMFNPVPHWDVDPFLFPTPITTIGPTALLVLDGLAVLGAAAAILTAPFVRTVAVLLWVIGAAFVIWHSVSDLEHLVVGGPWIATTAAIVGAMHLPAQSAHRRAAFAAVIGFVCILACRGAVQVFIEHSETVRSFNADRGAFFAARGWQPDSAEARLYLRRLSQPEATGWFGLSNVFASFAAMGLIAGGVLTIALARKKAWNPAGACAGALLAGALGLWLSGSKGGVGAAALIGTACVTLALVSRSETISATLGRAAGVLSIATVALGLAAVVARGLIGERLSELSLLFRWFYMQGATRIWASEPIAGVGPAGFKDAYLIAKPPLSPEEVTSPHSIVFDWVAALGLGGWAWAVLLGVAVWFIGRGLVVRGRQQDGQQAPAPPRAELLAAVVPGVVAMACSAFFERAMATPDMAIARVIGVVGMGLVAWGVLAAWRSAPGASRLALAAAGLVLGVHAMIEMTPIQPGSGVLWGLVLGLAAGGLETKRTARSFGAGWAARGIGAAAAVVLAGAVAALGGSRIPAWELDLGRAAESSREVGLLRQRLMREASEGRASMSREALESMVRSARSESLDALLDALDARPRHSGTRKAAARVAGELGQIDRAVELAEEGTRLGPDSPGAWAWLTGVLAGAAELEPDEASRNDLLTRAIEAGERAASLDPYGVGRRVRLAELEHARGNPAATAAWAEEALKLDDLRRLDPEKQLGDRERARLRSLAGND